MKVSVIIPTYKPGAYIFECIESIKNQTLCHDKFEILVVLNGPKEPYYTSLYEIKYPHMNLYYSENTGVSNARNIGLEHAIGEYICFIDDDDIISPTFLERLLEVADKESLAISYCNSFINHVEEKGDDFFICKQLKYRKNIEVDSHFRNRSFLSFPVAKLIHRDMIGNRRYDCRFRNGEDSLFITSISDKIKRLKLTKNDAIYYVRVRPGSASRKHIPLKQLIMDSIKLIVSYIVIYFKNPFSYYLPLFLSRIPGVLKNMYILSKNE